MTLPSGTITFLFTDIEGSTRLWEEHPHAMSIALARHDTLLRQCIEANQGVVFKTIGDAFCAAFATASDGLAAALAAQCSLDAEPWPEGLALRVRMALHTGTAESRDGDYFGQPLNRVARLLAVGHGGQTLLSAVAHDLIRDVLPIWVTCKPLGEHRLRDLGRPEPIFQLLHPDLPSDFPPLKSLNNPELLHNLPQQVTSFIGREKEIEAVKSLLARTRLLTLTGSGGCGKTRLGLQVAAEVLENYPQGVWFVELAPLADPALVPQSVAQVLDISEEAGKPLLQTLVAALKERKILLVLDNCEHVLDVCAQLVDTLIRACPDVRVLASSREGLGIGGETIYRVPSLSLPDLKQTPTPASLGMYEAARLFVDRAMAVQSAFTVTNQNAPALASICHHLDGIPLAIELAAARVRALSVEEINNKIDSRFRLLTGGSRTALPRQQTLRALIDWSYDLLNAQEKALLDRLSVFAGGWTLAAAEAVGVSEDVEEWKILDLLTSLVDKSLVTTEAQAEQTRYRLLETVRQYARDKLVESGKSMVARAQHRDHFLKLTKEVHTELSGPQQIQWLKILEEEHDNLRQALTFCLEEAEGGEKGLQLGGTLQQFWWTRGHLSEGREWMRALLLHPEGQAHTIARACAFNGAGVMARMQGDYTLARALQEEGLAIYRELGAKRHIAITLGNLGTVAEAQGDNASAWSLQEESLTIRRELGDRQGIALSLGNLGNVAYMQGDYASARSLYEESLAIRRELGDKRGIAMSLSNIGAVTFEQGDYASARLLQKESVGIFMELGDKRSLAYTLEAFASLAKHENAVKRSVRLMAAAAALRELLGAPLPPLDSEKQKQEEAAVQQILGEAAFVAAWEEGRALTWEQAVAYALEL